MDLPVFKIFTGALEPYEQVVSGQSRKYLRTTATSSVKDLNQDEFQPDAIRRMAASARDSGMTIFLNHEYKVPEDVFGTTVDSRVEQRGSDSRGMPIWDMDLDIVLNEANPRAVQTYASIEQGVKMGVSVGVLLKAWEPRDRKSLSAGVIITDAILKEASIVGIPANPRSWVRNAARAIKSAVAERPGVLTDPDDKEDSVDEPHTPPEQTTTVETDVEVTIPSPFEVPPREGGPRMPDSPEVERGVEAPAPAVAVEDEETKRPTSLGGASGEGVEPLAPKTASTNEDSLTVMAVTSLELATKQIADLRTQLTTKEAEITQIRTERDEAFEGLRIATSIVQKIAALPIGKKTSFAAGVNEFKQNLAGVYDEDFLKFLQE